MAAGSAALLAPHIARAATVIDDAGRALTVPAKTRRVFPAGPAAAVLLYTLAPELLLDWPDVNRPEACVYMLRDVCERPALGRHTGRGSAADAELVTALKSDLILDVD